MFGVGVRCPKNATLLGGPNFKCHIKSQSFKVAYDNAIITKWSVGKMGQLLSQYEMQFLLQKAVKGQTMKLYEDLPDEITEVCLTKTSFEGQVWQLFFDGASRIGPRANIVAGVG